MQDVSHTVSGFQVGFFTSRALKPRRFLLLWGGLDQQINPFFLQLAAVSFGFSATI